METNLGQQSPKLNVTNVSSAVFGKEGGATLGKESNIGKLARIVRTTRLKVNEVEKSITGISAKFLEIDKKITLNTENITGNTKKTETNAEKIKGNTKKTETNAEKITRLKKILQNQKSKIGEKLPGSTEEKEKVKLNTTLTETNRILVEIQKQLAYDFAMRAAEDKQEVAEEKEATSKERFKREESALEKSAKAMVSTVKTATKKIVSPIGNIFQKLLAFIGILAKGIAVNAAFEWFKDPENQKKITKFFNILQKNWKLIAKILGVIGGAILIGKIIAFIGAIKGLVAFIVGPLVAGLTKAAAGIAAAAGGAAVAGGALAVAGGVAAGAGLLFGMKAAFDLTKKKASGGQAHYDAFNQLIAELNEKGITVKGSGKGEKFYLTGTGRGAGDRHQKSASGGTEEQKALVEEYKKRRDAVISNRDAMRAEMDNQKDAVVPVMKTITGNQRGGKSGSREMIDNQATNKLRQEAEDKVKKLIDANLASGVWITKPLT